MVLILLICSTLGMFKLSTRALWALVFICILTTAQNAHLQLWGDYHYYTGIKYFGEIGYTELYDCTLIAIGKPNILHRDLETLEFTTATRPCAFEGLEGWEDFAKEVGSNWEVLKGVALRDKGLNATPFQVAVSEPFTRLPLEAAVWLDPLTLGIAVLAVGFWVNWRRAAYVALFVLTFYGTLDRLWGHFGQWWWLALVIVGISLIHRSKWWGGALLGFSATLMVFPVFLLVGRNRKTLVWGALGVAVGLFIGLFNSRGIDAYIEFAQDMRHHSEFIRYEPFNVGLYNTLSMSLSSHDLMQDWLICFHGGDCVPYYDFVSPILPWILMLPLVVWTRPGLIFGVLTLSRYYYLILATSIIEHEEWVIRLMFILNTLLFCWRGLNKEMAHSYSHLLWIVFFGVLSTASLKAYRSRGFAAIRTYLYRGGNELPDVRRPLAG